MMVYLQILTMQTAKEKTKEQQETSENFSEYAGVNAVTENLFSSSLAVLSMFN